MVEVTVTTANPSTVNGESKVAVKLTVVNGENNRRNGKFNGQMEIKVVFKGYRTT